MRTFFVMAAITFAACCGSRIRLQPALCFEIFGTGHPMLTSTMSAPRLSTICAASAIFSGSPPKIWMDTGRSSSVNSVYSSVRSIPRTSPSELTISVTTRPHPPWRFTSRRNAVSVIPAMGATTNGAASGTEPIFTALQYTRLVRLDVGGINFHADTLADEINREDEARVRPFTNETAHHAFQGAVHHLHEGPLF